MLDKQKKTTYRPHRRGAKTRCLWFPSLMFGDGLAVSVLVLTMVMLRRMGLDTPDTALAIALLCLPVLLRPLFEMIVTHFWGTTKVWILSTQFISALSLAAVAFTLHTSYWLLGTACFMPFFVCSALFYNIALHRFYIDSPIKKLRCCDGEMVTLHSSNLNTSTPQHLNTSTPQHLNISTSQHLNTSTPQHLNLNTSTSQPLNPSTSEPHTPSTSQPHPPSTSLLAYTPADNSRGRHEGAAARWTLSTSATTGMGASSVTNSTATYVEAVGPDNVIWADNPQLGIGIFNQGKSVKTEYKHRLPVRVGFNVAYRLTDRLSVESGVSYTRLSSDMKDGTKDNYSSGSQKLDYIGVPLNVKYRAFGYRRLSVYASAGLLTEKCVSGKTTHEYVISGEKKKHEAEDVAAKPWQLSVNAALGAQFDVLRNVGVYVEPGVSYYFDDRSTLSTIYKEKPLNFNLNLGVRYTIGK